MSITMLVDVDDSSRSELKSLLPKIESFIFQQSPRLKIMTHFVNQLNNVAQSNRWQQPVYSDTFTGPNHSPIWTSTVHISEVQNGQGSGPNRGAARENAARQALQVAGLPVQ
ncbi:hypothetical protein K435DRAFT_793281 [Dendrothele bispora CBS 962.96]|uniref:DRBM domain-containing protein n=1 Tax=Dendrothele bispora (strain CBS 962.96) TaxID=1314807 RepID=A0A4S8MG69_DENBC|nr:hypothetical protein K435DRAFT_793281 [Dendrothele bispora CBS 962.96]